MVDTAISGLPGAAGANRTDQLPANQAGTTRRLTVAQILAAIQGADFDDPFDFAGVALGNFRFDGAQLTGPYTFQLSDSGKVKIWQGTAAVNFTIPLALPFGWRCEVDNMADTVDADINFIAADPAATIIKGGRILKQDAQGRACVVSVVDDSPYTLKIVGEFA